MTPSVSVSTPPRGGLHKRQRGGVSISHGGLHPLGGLDNGLIGTARKISVDIDATPDLLLLIQ